MFIKMQTITYDIPNLEKRLRAGQFQVPHFQREFVWRESQVKLLIDSIARGYPIGSLLVLPDNPNGIHLYSRGINAMIKAIDDEGEKDDNEEIASEVRGIERFFVLDGQQRLTSIARVFLNASHKVNYYFDLKKMIDKFDAQDFSWIITRQRGKNDPPKKENGRLLRADLILRQEETDIAVSEYIEDYSEFQEKKSEGRRVAAKIKGIFENIRKYQVPIVALDRDANIESVCRIFETINSTGTRLTTFDLAVAKYYPEPDLRTLLNESLNNFYLKEFEVDGEQFLQLLYLWYTCEYNERKNIEPTRSKLLSLDKKYIEKNWERAASCLNKAYEWIKEENGVRKETLVFEGLVVSIASFCGLFPSLFDNADCKLVLKRWFFCNLLQEGNRIASNYQIGVDTLSIIEFGDNFSRYGHGNGKPDFSEVRLSNSRLIGLSSKNNVYKAVQAICQNYTKVDLKTGGTLKDDIHYHHIFPKSLNQKRRTSAKSLESVVNKIPVLVETNTSWGADQPNLYLANIIDDHKKNGTMAGLLKRFESCLLPYDPLDESFISSYNVDNFENFLMARSEIILSKIKEIIGDSLVVSDNPISSEENEV